MKEMANVRGGVLAAVKWLKRVWRKHMRASYVVLFIDAPIVFPQHSHTTTFVRLPLRHIPASNTI